MPENPATIRPIHDADRPAVAALNRENWGDVISVAHDTVFRPAELPGFVAIGADDEILGVLTYTVPAPETFEVVTLDAGPRRAGIGTALIAAAVERATELGCARIVLTTTNDNVDALRFYQRRGFRLTAVRPDAVNRTRATVKPSIPTVGDYGIPLTDELDLERILIVGTR